VTSQGVAATAKSVQQAAVGRQDSSSATPSVAIAAAKPGRADAFSKLLQAGSPQRSTVENQQTTSVALKALGLALKEGGGEVTMKLAPEALGKVSVKLNIHDATFDATFTTTTASARELLDQNLSTGSACAKFDCRRAAHGCEARRHAWREAE
jgi:flagellar hook-length control protein FliK